MNNHSAGVSCSGAASSFLMKDSLIQGNRGSGVRLDDNSKGQLTKCRFVRNKGGILDKETGSSCAPCSGNVAVVSSLAQKSLPGFRIENENEPNEAESPATMEEETSV